MRYANRKGAEFAEGDMTPMIDMTFQLIAFFMVLISFSEADQNQLIKLPSSELAKPPDGPLELPITLQLTEKTEDREEMVIFGPKMTPLESLKNELLVEWNLLKASGRNPADATIIIRAHLNAQTGKVQRMIQVCQELGFEKFALRAKQQEREGT